MRNAITAFFRLALRIFFRRIEIVGLQRVPETGPVIFAVNHPNGLVDPLFVLTFASRPVSFLGKAPLFHYFFIGWFVRLFDTIPVYRKQDNTTGTNKETFARARAVLRSGGSIAIFPEGTTHDDPQLRALKTGAARIALGAALDDIAVVPTGIYYTAKHLFRSSAMVIFGEPIRVGGRASRPPAPGILPGATGEGEPPEPPVEDVVHLTAAIDAGLDAVTVQADSHAALDLIARAEDIFTADDEQPLAREFELRRRFIEGYHYLRTNDPGRLEKLESAVTRFVSELRRARIDVHELKPRIDMGRLFRVLVLLPIALIGAIVNYPTYRLVRVLALRFAKGEEAVTATMKVLASLVLYPLTYIAIGAIVGWRFGWEAGVAALLGLPAVAYLALLVFEDLDDIIGDARALGHRLFRRYGYERLVAQREEIKRDILAVAREMGV